MKKQLLTMALLVLSYAGLNAQILTDNFDSYTLGYLGPQADHWSTWSGAEATAEDGIVSDNQANSGANSLKIGNDSAQDVVLLLGDSATGAYNLSWNMFVPADSTAYYNFQGQAAIGTDFVIEIFLNGGVISFGSATSTDTALYPVGEWFEIKHQIDLDADILNVLINGVGVYSGPYVGTSGNLSSIDFYAASGTNTYYIDDIFLDSYMSCPVPDALICDNFEAYDLGQEFIGPQSSIWTTWTGLAGEGTVMDGLLTDEYANSGTQCLLIEEGGDQDVVLLLGDHETGRYSLSWDIFFEDESTTGYYNLQGAAAIGTSYMFDCFFNKDGLNVDTATFDQNSDFYVYPIAEWFHVEHIIDLDNDMMYLMVNGSLVTSLPYTGMLSAVDFWSIDGDNRMYIDDVVLTELDAVVPCDATNVIYCENFDVYSAGTTLGQWSEEWTTWSGTEGTAEDGIVSSEQANSGANSMLIAEGGTQDVVLTLNNADALRYDVTWEMFVPDSATGYYNFQGNEAIGTSYVLEVYLNQDGTNPGLITFDPSGDNVDFAFPHGEWFEIKHDIDLDNDEIKIYVNSALAYTGEYVGSTTSNLSSIDFYSAGSINRYYVDDIVFEEHPVGISELGASNNISIYPNPNTGTFTLLNDDEAGVYTVNVMDLTGRKIMSRTMTLGNGSTTEFVLDNVTTGVYLVQLFDEANTTVKIIKMVVE